MAQVLIDREHPLQDLLIWDTLPCLRKCKKRLPDFIPNQTEGDLDSSSSEDEAAATNVNTSDQLNQNDDEASQLISEDKESIAPAIKKISQMDRYQEAAKKALAQDGDNLTYNTLIQKLD